MKSIGITFKKLLILILVNLFFQFDYLFPESCNNNLVPICSGTNPGGNTSCHNLNCNNSGCNACIKNDRHFYFNKETCQEFCNKKFKPECLPCYKKICKKNCNLECNQPRTIFIPRSQGANTARELVGWEEYLHRYPECNNYFNFAQTISYNQSIRPQRIAQYLFGGCNLSFAGSNIKDKRACEIYADNFGLSPNFRGTLHVSPIIQNIVFDNQFYFGLDRLACGLYARINAPLAYSIWDLNLKQINTNQENQECTDFSQCQMSSDPAKSTCNIKQALSGNFIFGDMQTPWKAGKFCSRQSRFGLADIDLILGYDFWKDENYHLGFYAQGVVPTGNKPNPKYVFSPIVGNGKHWEFGAGISGRLLLWNNGPDETLNIYLEGNVTHLFKNKQCRTFDLCQNGPLSRYLLLKELTQTDGNYSYAGNLVNTVNFTTREITSSVSVKGDISAKLAYKSRCFSADLGYNFYGNTQETVKLRSCKLPDNYGIKGDTGTCALEYATSAGNFSNLVDKINLNATESDSTVRVNGPIDNPANIPVPTGDIPVTYNSVQTGSTSGDGVIIAKESKNPELLSSKKLNILSGTAGATATHKVFANINYNFDERCYPNYTPFIGIGGELEIEALACNEQTSMNQWGLWIKGGIAF